MLSRNVMVDYINPTVPGVHLNGTIVLRRFSLEEKYKMINEKFISKKKLQIKYC